MAITVLASASGRVDVAALSNDLVPVISLYEGRALGEIALGPLTQEVLAVVRRHHLQLPNELALLLKMIVMIEGVGVALDPQFQPGEVTGPYVRKLVSERYSPSAAARWLTQAGGDLVNLVAQLPDQLRRLQDMLDAGGPEVHLRAAELELLLERFRSTGDRLVVAILAAAFLRGIGDLVAADPERRKAWQGRLLGAGLGAAGSLGTHLVWSGRRERKRRA